MLQQSARWVAVVGISVAAFGCASGAPATATHASSQACSTVGRADVHEALLRQGAIISITPLSERPFVARRSPLKDAKASQQAKLVGVRLVVKPGPGVTGEWLQLLANCDRHLPLHAHPAQEDCPFELADTTTSVRSLGDAFAVDIKSSDPAVAQESIRRAEALAK